MKLGQPSILTNIIRWCFVIAPECAPFDCPARRGYT
jgi:hypothetical protein